MQQTLTRKYHIKEHFYYKFNEEGLPESCENLRRLFDDAMGPVAEMAPEGLRDRVMKIAGIQQPKYYDKVLTLATEKRIVKTTIAKNGRVVVIPIPS